MNSIERILAVVVDAKHGERALDSSLPLAVDHDASITVIDVNPYLDAYTEALEDIMPGDELRALVLDHRSTQLERLVRERPGLAAQIAATKVLDGVPFIEIIRDVLTRRHDLIVKVAESDVSAKKRAFGSTDMHLIRKSPVPVWIVHPERVQPDRRVLAAIDPLASGEAAAQFNRRILALAKIAAGLSGAKLHVLSVWQLVGEETMRHSPFLKIDERRIEELLEHTEDRVRAYQASLARWFETAHPDATVPKWHTVKGVAHTAIPAFLRDNDVDLAVMGSVGRSGIPGLLIGGTAESVLNDVDCSVLTVKPEGFVTPVVPEDQE